jgi:DNA-directed RNA polymerase II subunit RPB7
VEQIASVFGNACVGEEKVDEVPPFSDLIFAGDARYDEPVEEGAMNNKLSGLRSYRLEDNPTYMKLFPEVLSADGTSRAERPATPANKAPQAQNMV